LRPVTNVSSSEFLVAFLIAAAAGTAVFFHAEKHKVPHPSAWASFVFLFLIAGLPSYLLRVRRLRKQRERA
jgi:Flp pilus assembly protein TadB